MEKEAMPLRSEEKVILELRRFYRQYGYTCFKMNKFEEYDLYSRNKDYLISDGVITFTDTNGRLMALKPDVTLSIIQNFKMPYTGVQRVYYNESVYRISDRTHTYREIMQTGLECLGDVTEYNLHEVVRLAALSLSAVSKKSVLTLSHLGILSDLLSHIPRDEAYASLISRINRKDSDGVAEICAASGYDPEISRLLVELTHSYGAPDQIISRFRALSSRPVIGEALDCLSAVARQAQTVPDVTVCVDLSLTSNMNYYNGLIFEGFVEGIPSGVLLGGQYDLLMAKMNKPARAIGFAVYLDLLERLDVDAHYDVDVLLLYDPHADPAAVRMRVSQLIEAGKTVSAQTAPPPKLTYRTIERLEI